MAEVVISSLQLIGYHTRVSPYYRDGYTLACEVGQVECYVDLCREHAPPAYGGPAAACHIAEMVCGYVAYFEPPPPITITVSACPAAAHHAALGRCVRCGWGMPAGW